MTNPNPMMGGMGGMGGPPMGMAGQNPYATNMVVPHQPQQLSGVNPFMQVAVANPISYQNKNHMQYSTNPGAASNNPFAAEPEYRGPSFESWAKDGADMGKQFDLNGGNK